MRGRAWLAVSIASGCLVHAAGACARGGDPDATFGSGGAAAMRATGFVNWDVLARADGATVSVVYTDSSQRSDLQVQRTLDDGRPDGSFGTNGVATLPGLINVHAVTVQPDGSVVLVGTQRGVGNSVGNNSPLGFVRLRPDGTIDASFGDAGWSFFGAAGVGGLGTIQVLSDGRIAAALIRGDFPVTGGPSAEHVSAIRMLANGRPDPSYGVGGLADYAFGDDWPIDTIGRVRVLADGGVEVAHDAGGSLAVSRLAPDGSVDRAFGTAGTRTTIMPFALTPGATRVAFLPDGSLIVAVDTFLPQIMSPGEAQNELAVTSVGPGGDVQSSFGIVGVARTRVFASEIHSILSTPDGGIVLVGLMDVPGGRFEVLKLDAQGRLDAAFGHGGSAVVSVPVDVFYAGVGTMGADGFLTVVGIFDGHGDGWLARVQAVGDVVEFHNAALDHYFMTYDGAEAAGIELRGTAGPGWSRTGASFRPGGPAPVCRFYGTPGIGPNSHFYTAEPDECDAVKRDAGWTYEGIGFYAMRSEKGSCPGALVPVHRLYNDGFARHIDSNHRYVTDLSSIAPMVANGWIHEGVAFCAKP